MLQRKQWGHGGDALLGQRLRLVHNGQVLCERGVVGLLHQHEIHQVLQQRRWGGGLESGALAGISRSLAQGHACPAQLRKACWLEGGETNNIDNKKRAPKK